MAVQRKVSVETLQKNGLIKPKPRPMLFVPYYFAAHKKVSDRYTIADSLTVGRLKQSEIVIDDHWLSRAHFRVSVGGDLPVIEDLNSTNGTYLNGLRITGVRPLDHGDLIRAGRCLFVYSEEREGEPEKAQGETFGMVGDFHVAALIRRLETLARGQHNVVISGAPGTGKSLAAYALARLTKREISVCRTGEFPADDKVAAALFGDSGQPGLIAAANGKVLIIEDVHCFSEPLQQRLLAAIDGGIDAGRGKRAQTPSDVRYILTSDEAPPDYGLTHDLLAGMRAVIVPPLCFRIADIPGLFRNALKAAIHRTGMGDFNNTFSYIHADHYESLCLDGFKRDNVNGLSGVADQVAEHMAFGQAPEDAIAEVFENRYGDYPSMNRQYGVSPIDDLDEDELTSSTRKFLVIRARREVEEQRLMKDVDIDQTTLEIIKEAHVRCEGMCQGIASYMRENYDIDIPHDRLVVILDRLDLPLEDTWFS